MVYWCLCLWWTYWFLWPTLVETGSWASSESSGCCAHYAHSGRRRLWYLRLLSVFGWGVQNTCYVIWSLCDLRSVCAGLQPCLVCGFQGDQPRPWIKAGRRDPHHLSEANREHRSHLLSLLHFLWHLWISGAFSHKVVFAFNVIKSTTRGGMP